MTSSTPPARAMPSTAMISSFRSSFTGLLLCRSSAISGENRRDQIGRGKSRNERAGPGARLATANPVGDNRPCPGDSAAERRRAGRGSLWPGRRGGGRRLAVSAVAISTLAGIAAFLYLYPAGGYHGGVMESYRVQPRACRRRRPAGARPRRTGGAALERPRRGLGAPPAARGGAPVAATTAPDPRLDDLSADVQEATAEIALLGEILRDLAVAVAAHDRELAALKAAGEKPVPVQREAPRPTPQVAAPARGGFVLPRGSWPAPPIGRCRSGPRRRTIGPAIPR